MFMWRIDIIAILIRMIVSVKETLEMHLLLIYRYICNISVLYTCIHLYSLWMIVFLEETCRRNSFVLASNRFKMTHRKSETASAIKTLTRIPDMIYLYSIINSIGNDCSFLKIKFFRKKEKRRWLKL